MTKKSNTKWFIHCKDDASNESVAEAIGGLHGTTTNFKLMECSDDVPRYLYEVSDYQFAKRFVNRNKQLFEMFVSTDDGKPKDCGFLDKKKKITLTKIRKESKAIVRSALQHRQR